MKYEFVEFYPFVKEKSKNIVGTCHIYVTDMELDIRGILVIQVGRGFLFRMPSRKQFDPEAKKDVNYPVVMFTSEQKLQELWDFLHKNALPEIKKKLQTKKRKPIEITNGV